MKKLNNSGFMLAEIIIVSAIIMITMVGLYKGFSDTYKAYEIRNSYYDVKTIYALKNFENFLIDEMLLNTITDEMLLNTITDECLKIEQTTFNNDNDSYQYTFISSFFETYSIKELYIVKYDKIDNFKDSNSIDSNFKDYLEYYIKNIKSDDNDYNYNYVLFAVTNENKYSALKIK